MLALSVIWTLIDVLLNRDWNGNGVGNKGVKIRIKSELCTLRFLSSRLRLSYPTVDVQRCVISFMYFFFSLPVLNSLWHSCIALWVSWFSYSHNKSTEGGRGAGPETQSSRTWRVLFNIICAYYKPCQLQRMYALQQSTNIWWMRRLWLYKAARAQMNSLWLEFYCFLSAQTVGVVNEIVPVCLVRWQVSAQLERTATDRTRSPGHLCGNRCGPAQF